MAENPQRVLVLGVTGMLGSAMFRFFSNSPEFIVFGTARSSSSLRHFTPNEQQQVITNIDVLQNESLVDAFTASRPDVVINCVGVVKQLKSGKDPLTAIPINSLLPHRLRQLTDLSKARLVHISTDCVFSGRKGNYVESDLADADDIYGRSKLLGEVDGPDAVTLRTSIIGHELEGNHSLVDWFLSQKAGVRGYNKAIFSGVPTCELARIIRDFVIPNAALSGLHHVSAAPIDKYRLLTLVAAQYGHDVPITPDDALVIDRSLDSSRFRQATGYRPPDWEALVAQMHNFG